MKREMRILIIVAALLLCCCVPVSAVVQEVTLKGTVATVNAPKNTITIEHCQQFGCIYTTTAPVCTYTPMSVDTLTGTVPDAAAFSVFKTGDPIVATSIGGAGETWITLAKLYGSRPNEESVTDIVGDPTSLPNTLLLVGQYDLDLTTAPDCQQCPGTSCTAASSLVKIKYLADVLAEKTLTPGQSFTYNGRNDGSSVAVTFVKGQALSESCPGAQKGLIGGVQPVSVYIVKAVPPIGMAQSDIRTATTTRPDEALPKLTPAPASPVSPVSTANAAAAPTTKSSGTLPFAVIGALGLLALVLAARKN
jgi:hypothetical protein